MVNNPLLRLMMIIIGVNLMFSVAYSFPWLVIILIIVALYYRFFYHKKSAGNTYQKFSNNTQQTQWNQNSSYESNYDDQDLLEAEYVEREIK